MNTSDQDLERRIQQLVDRAVASVREEFERKLEPLLSGADAAPWVDEVAVDDLGHLHDALQLLEDAETQSQALDTLLAASEGFASRCAFFLADRDGVRGWGARGFDAASVRESSFDYEAHAVWRRLASEGMIIVLEAAERAQLATSMLSSPGRDAVLVPLTLRGAVAGALYADRLDPADRLETRGLEILTRMAGLSLETQPLRSGITATSLADEAPTPAAPAPEPDGSGDETTFAGAGAAAAAGIAGVTAAMAGEDEPEVEVEHPAETEPMVVAPEAEASEELDVNVLEKDTVAAELHELEVDLEQAERDEIELEPIDETPTTLDATFGEPEPEPLAEQESVVSIEEPMVVDEIVTEPEGATEQIETSEPETVEEDEDVFDVSDDDVAPFEPAEAETLQEASSLEGDQALADEVDDDPWDSGPPDFFEQPDEVVGDSADDGMFRVETLGSIADQEEASDTLEIDAFDTAEGAVAETDLESAETVALGETPVDEPEEPGPAAEVTVVGSQIVPPADLTGPGTAFLSDLSVSEVMEDSVGDEAQRLARLLVGEIKLYNEDEVNRGRKGQDIYNRLRDDIDRSRQIFEERIDTSELGDRDPFREELVRILAGGDEDALGM